MAERDAVLNLIRSLKSLAHRGALIAMLAPLVLASCLPKALSERQALAELRNLEVYARMRLPQAQFTEKLTESRARLELHLRKVDSEVAMEMRRAFAFYQLGSAPGMARIRGRPNISAEELFALGKEQTDFVEKFANANLRERQRMLASRPEIEAEMEVEAPRVPKAYINPLTGKPNEIFTRPPASPAPGQPPPWKPLTKATPAQRPAPVVMLQTYEAKTQYGSVKLQAGTRLEVLAQDGESITAQSGRERITIPVRFTRPAP
jgi:hypothetical protein